MVKYHSSSPKIALLLSSHSASIAELISTTLIKMGYTIKLIDPSDSSLNCYNKTEIRLANKLKLSKLSKHLASQRKVVKNELILKEIVKFNPEIVLTYNDSDLLPETVKKIKSTAKFVVFLGDSPFYSFYKDYFLQIVIDADLVVAPDSGWRDQLKSSGVRNIIYGILGVGLEYFKPVELTSNQIVQYNSDVFYLGSFHSLEYEAWALKRPLFLMNFINHGMKLFGNYSWNKILPQFPELKNSFTLLERPMSYEELNLRMNCTKIYPVDANPGLIKGIHVRAFDSISAGTLPLVEYREDIDKVFTEVKPPVFKDFDEAQKLADFYIKNDDKREDLAKALNQYLFENYQAEQCLERILSYL